MTWLSGFEIADTMSEVRAAIRSLLNMSHSLWVGIASFFLSLWETVRRTFRRRHYVELVTNEEKSAPVSGESSTSIMEMIKTKCPSLWGAEAYFKPTWWLLGYVPFFNFHHSTTDSVLIHLHIDLCLVAISRQYGALSAS